MSVKHHWRGLGKTVGSVGLAVILFLVLSTRPVNEKCVYERVYVNNKRGGGMNG